MVLAQSGSPVTCSIYIIDYRSGQGIHLSNGQMDICSLSSTTSYIFTIWTLPKVTSTIRPRQSQMRDTLTKFKGGKRSTSRHASSYIVTIATYGTYIHDVLSATGWTTRCILQQAHFDIP